MSSDLEWYLNVEGKQTGPLTAKEIVDRVRAGKIPATSQVTAARMGGDWVTAQDLIDAYDELYSKKTPSNPARPITPMEEPGGPMGFGSDATQASPFASTGDPNFNPPPRPTEHLERSKIITLNREDLEDRPPDPTEALFQAIQAVREKSAQKSAGQASLATPLSSSKDSWGQLQRPSQNRIPPQFLFIATLAGILGVMVYGAFAILGGKKESAPAGAPVADAPPPSRPAAPVRQSSGSGLLNADGSGQSAARTEPPVRVAPAPRPATQPIRRERTPLDDRDSRLEPGGGARYRDERDPPIEADERDRGAEADVDEAEPGSEIDPRDPRVPMDPSDISPDRDMGDPAMPSLRDREEMMPEDAAYQ